jgi:hypothetical protein
MGGLGNKGVRIYQIPRKVVDVRLRATGIGDGPRNIRDFSEAAPMNQAGKSERNDSERNHRRRHVDEVSKRYAEEHGQNRRPYERQKQASSHSLPRVQEKIGLSEYVT